MICTIQLQHVLLTLTVTLTTWIGDRNPEAITAALIDDMTGYVAVSRRCDEVVHSRREVEV